MKKTVKSGSSLVLVAVIIAIVAAFGALVAWAYHNKKIEQQAIAGYNEKAYIGPSAENGNIGDNYIGNKDAKVLVIEYADFQCPGCATTFPYIHDVISEYGDRIGYIYRSYVLSYHKNGTSSAAAANAAAKQGYWSDYALLLFKNQSEWEYANESERDAFFDSYFMTASKNSGDLDKFHADMHSDEVQQKVSFDTTLGKRIKIDATPTIFINGENFDFEGTTQTQFKDKLRGAIDSALSK